MSYHRGPKIVYDSLYLLYDPGSPRCYPGSGTDVYDLSRYGHNGTLINGLAYSTANTGCFNFDGSNDHISVGTTSVGALTQYTVAHWCRRDSENRMHIGTSNNYFYWYGDNSWRWVHGGASGEHYYSKTVSIPSGTWGYYVATYDATTVRIYRQGVFQSSVASSGTANFDGQNWTFGQFASSSTYAFNGLGGIVAIYTRALTADEILKNYNATKSRYGL